MALTAPPLVNQTNVIKVKTAGKNETFVHSHYQNPGFSVGLSARFPLLQDGILWNVILSVCPGKARPYVHSRQAALGSEMEKWLELLRWNVALPFTPNHNSGFPVWGVLG